MSPRYSLHDAERWAVFSGDDNPIHFDAAEARRRGMSGLCVHGMRAMLDVKSTLSSWLVKHAPDTGGLLFSCRLREPVACDQPYQLQVSETSGHGQLHISGNLLNTQTQRVSISSKLTSTSALSLLPVKHLNTLDGDALAELYVQFLAVGIPAAPQWSFLEAVLFRQLINATATLDTVRTLAPQHDVASLRDVFRVVRVVQTHHEVHFAPGLLSDREENRVESLDYAIEPTLLMGEKQTGLVLQIGIQAWHAREPLMSVTVTLKTGPLAERTTGCPQ